MVFQSNGKKEKKKLQNSDLIMLNDLNLTLIENLYTPERHN